MPAIIPRGLGANNGAVSARSFFEPQAFFPAAIGPRRCPARTSGPPRLGLVGCRSTPQSQRYLGSYRGIASLNTQQAKFTAGGRGRLAAEPGAPYNGKALRPANEVLAGSALPAAAFVVSGAHYDEPRQPLCSGGLDRPPRTAEAANAKRSARPSSTGVDPPWP